LSNDVASEYVLEERKVDEGLVGSAFQRGEALVECRSVVNTTLVGPAHCSL